MDCHAQLNTNTDTKRRGSTHTCEGYIWRRLYDTQTKKLHHYPSTLLHLLSSSWSMTSHSAKTKQTPKVIICCNVQQSFSVFTISVVTVLPWRLSTHGATGSLNEPNLWPTTVQHQPVGLMAAHFLCVFELVPTDIRNLENIQGKQWCQVSLWMLVVLGEYIGK